MCLLIMINCFFVSVLLLLTVTPADNLMYSQIHCCVHIVRMFGYNNYAS